MAPQRASPGLCAICGEKALCHVKLNVAVARRGQPPVDRVLVCARHYSMYRRFGRFWNLKRSIPEADRAHARRLYAAGSSVFSLAADFSVSYRTMLRYLNPKASPDDIEAMVAEERRRKKYTPRTRRKAPPKA